MEEIMSIMSGYVQKQKKLLAPYIGGSRSLLDFGCGDLSLSKLLHTEFPALAITGVDVVDSGIRADGITFRLYDGKTLPFKNNTFDVSISYHVFHHTSDPRAAFGELARVTKNKLLIVEPCLPAGRRSGIDLFFMKILDRFGNGWRGVTIPMPFTFRSEATWRRFAREFHWNVAETKTVGVLPRWLPIGETKLFVLTIGLNRYTKTTP
ncbi:MAG: class I SAM-dependent methyltransferase [Candidatus Gottesmanbacteria bacterium]|nr:class I SAM-dependent methyltransferase [Candidatus Gottesmanbacteria bacterium]